MCDMAVSFYVRQVQEKAINGLSHEIVIDYEHKFLIFLPGQLLLWLKKNLSSSEKLQKGSPLYVKCMLKRNLLKMSL
jgi:hypothetical protein